MMPVKSRHHRTDMTVTWVLSPPAAWEHGSFCPCSFLAGTLGASGGSIWQFAPLALSWTYTHASTALTRHMNCHSTGNCQCSSQACKIFTVWPPEIVSIMGPGWSFCKFRPQQCHKIYEKYRFRWEQYSWNPSTFLRASTRILLPRAAYRWIVFGSYFVVCSHAAAHRLQTLFTSAWILAIRSSFGMK